MAEPRVHRKNGPKGLEISVVGNQIRTLEGLLSAAEVDATQWEVADYKVNKWDMPIAGGRIATMWQVKASLRPVLLTGAVEDFIATLAASSPVRLLRRSARDGRYMLEVAPFDLHLGMRAWAAQTGVAYNPEQAEELFSAAVSELVSRVRSYDVARVLLPVGNDFLHYDTKDGRTTNLTQQDSAIGLQEMFQRGTKLLVDAIDCLACVAPVEVVTIPGNHDEQGSLFLGSVLSAWYRNDPNVTVDAGPTHRKYVRHGVTLLGFTHGKYERVSDLPAIMAREQPQQWSETKHREWHLGHRHKLEASESQGVRIRRLPSLAATDEWHTRQGYHSLRAMEAYLWDRDRGYAGHLNINATEL